MAGRPSAKAKVEEVKIEEVVVENKEVDNLKAENQAMAEMLKQMQEQLKQMQAQSQVVPQVQIMQDSNATRTIKVANLIPNLHTLSTEPNGQGRGNKDYVFRKFGETKNIPFMDLQKIISHCEERFAKGYVVLPSQKDYEDLQIGYVYDSVLSKDRLEKVVELSDESSVDIILGLDEEMQEKVCGIIANKIVDGFKYDYNRIKELEDNGIMVSELVSIIKESKVVEEDK